MKSKPFLYCFLFLAVVFSSCESKEDLTQTKASKQIIGEWKWIESVYYYTKTDVPYIINPDTLGYHITYRFDENNKYQLFRGSNPDSEGNYWFETIKYDNGTESPLRLFTQEGEYIKSVNFSLSQDTLVFDETEVDGARRVFVREN